MSSILLFDWVYRKKEPDLEFIKIAQEVKRKIITESKDIYCNSCGSFLSSEGYKYFINGLGSLKCVNCGADIMTANNIKKIADRLEAE